MHARVFIGVGSNQRDPLSQVVRALALLERGTGVTEVARSRPYRTSPWGRRRQPPFVNAVAEFRCRHSPRALLRLCQKLESRLGRRHRREPWGPRPIDLDLLAFGALERSEPGLRLPHPRLAERRFVLVPWAEIAADFELPGIGSVAALLSRCEDAGTVEPLRWPARRRR